MFQGRQPRSRRREIPTRQAALPFNTRESRGKAMSTRSGLSVWPSQWIDSQSGPATITYNYRVLFFVCVSRVTPGVLDHLAKRILPLYKEMFWDEAERTGVNRTYFENGVRYHRRMARSWFRRSQDTWWDRYAAVRDPLLGWCDQYRLNA